MNKKNKTVTGYIIIGVCIVVFSALIMSAFVLKEEAYDPETFCLGEVSAHIIIVLDKTDTLSINHQRFILNYINKRKERLKRFEKFSIFSLTENTYVNPEPIFSKCNPGTGKNANKFYQNPKKIQMKFDKFFSKPLKDNMNVMLSDDPGSKSPILEIIRELSFRDDFNENVQDRTLIIISDMMHHTSQYSQYKNRINYEQFSRGTYADEVAVNLNSIKIRIVYLLRGKLERFQGKDHLSFWEDYFEDMGAGVLEIRRIR